MFPGGKVNENVVKEEVTCDVDVPTVDVVRTVDVVFGLKCVTMVKFSDEHPLKSHVAR